jgi:hypothetical protein
MSTNELIRISSAADTGERQLRAYVLATGKDLIEPTATQIHFIHRLEVKNTGLTPAYKLWIESLTRPLPHPLPKRFEFQIDPPGQNPSIMMLGSGQPTGHDSWADEPFSEGSGKRLYTYGTIRYEDAFGRQRYTNFCYFVEWKVSTGRYTISVHPSEQHNDAN